MTASPFRSQPPPIPVAGPRQPVPVLAQPAGEVAPLAAWTQHFAATPTAAGWARRHTADVLDHWRLRDLTWSACQVVSELVTNAVVHTDTGCFGQAASCRLTLKLFSDVLAVEVWDPADGEPRQNSDSGVLVESGRGLAIVGVLCVATPLVIGAPGLGKTVVALLARP